jgi:hypothetical protein
MICKRIPVAALHDDKRFFIDAQNLDYLSQYRIFGYSIETIPVGSILRDYSDGLYSIENALPFLLAKDPDNPDLLQAYDRYCKRARNQAGTSTRSVDSFMNLIQTLEHDEYSIKKGAIIIDQYDIILEGQHRACVLLNMHGAEYPIEVLRIQRMIRNPRTLFRIAQRNLRTASWAKKGMILLQWKN